MCGSSGESLRVLHRVLLRVLLGVLFRMLFRVLLRRGVLADTTLWCKVHPFRRVRNRCD